MSVITGHDGQRVECTLEQLREVDAWCVENNGKTRQDWLNRPKKAAKKTTKKAAKA